jgi:hypothetical protein
MPSRPKKRAAAGSAPQLSPEVPWAPRAQAAYTRCLPDIQGLNSEELLEVDIDVLHAAAFTLTVLPRCRRLRPLLSMLPAFDLQAFDKLEAYALAAAYVEISRLVLDGGGVPAPQETVQHEETLYRIDKHFLGAKQHVSAPPGAPCTAMERAQLLLQNAHRLRHALERLTIGDYGCDDDLEAVIRAEFHAEHLLAASQPPEHTEGLRARLADEGARAFTLLNRTYHHHTRAAIQYLEQGNAELESGEWKYATGGAMPWAGVEARDEAGSGGK